ncbi:hypothetical protein [Micromonospora humida]|uniref:hypothetical protein n=1 Tax=Micromonospora humida TaxID=2809018 RepID=UPI0034443D9C
MQETDTHDTVKRDPVPPFMVLLGWHLLVVAAYVVVLSRQSHERVGHDESPWVEMVIFGFTVGVPLLLVPLITGLILLWLFPSFPSKRGQISWPVIRGTLAATPLFLMVVWIIPAVPH